VDLQRRPELEPHLVAVSVLDGFAGLVLLGFVERLRNWRLLTVQVEA
jgi:hypothetical protein